MASSNGARIVPPTVPMTITQIAVVVADIESALRSYTENLGWGPWSVFEYSRPSCTTPWCAASRANSA